LIYLNKCMTFAAPIWRVGVLLNLKHKIMAVKIRLARGGRKRKPFYHIVVADSRAPRDGRYIDRIGDYNPNTNPATINLDLESAVNWLQKGAQPTDTTRAILSYKGAMYKNHLLVGVNKGSITEEQMNERFDAWMSEKTSKVESKQSGLADAKLKEKAAIMAAEVKRKEAIADKVLAKNSELAEAVEEEVAEAAGETVEAGAEEVVEAATEEVVEAAAEEVVEAAAEEVVEAVAEVKEEAPVAEVVEEEAPAAEVVEEAPAEEAPEAKEGE
jgi:small subunit ribosomal protein S16